jgi:sulfide dehydrogenase cytochrome subunit
MHMKLATLVLLALAAPTSAFAQATCPVAIDAQACSSCHGTDDRSSIPRLMGMDHDAFVTAMEAFQSGERESTIMGRLAAAYSAQDVEALADYFAADGQCL